MLVKILLTLAGFVAVLALIVTTRPSEFRVVRSTFIAAPASKVFAQVNDFHRWETWNPWGKIDPAMRHTYEGPPAGVGAAYTWGGNRQVGEGRMTILESRPNESIRVRLDFAKPFRGTSVAEFTFTPEGGGTRVTWSMTGRNNFFAKALHMVIDMDTMVGGNFEKGLADMKGVVEG